HTPSPHPLHTPPLPRTPLLPSSSSNHRNLRTTARIFRPPPRNRGRPVPSDSSLFSSSTVHHVQHNFQRSTSPHLSQLSTQKKQTSPTASDIVPASNPTKSDPFYPVASSAAVGIVPQTPPVAFCPPSWGLDAAARPRPLPPAWGSRLSGATLLHNLGATGRLFSASPGPKTLFSSGAPLNKTLLLPRP
ncbi:hypothetical protein CSPX01_04198, partial [Colletotrichum filicis]